MILAPTDPNCARCRKPHGLVMADLLEGDPSLPVYCLACEATVCDDCGQFGAYVHLHHGRYCDPCVARMRAPQGETVKLFEPAAAQLPGQLSL
jgi:hypothetical protein